MDDFDFLSTNAAPQQSEATGSEKTAATANIADDASWMMDSNPSTTTAAQSDLFGDDILGDVTKSTQSSAIDEFDFFGGNSASSESTQAPAAQADSLDFDNVDQSPVSTSTNANQDDLFREGFASNANPTSESQFDALDVNNSNNLLPTTTTTEQTDIFAGDSSNSAALPAPSPVVEQFDTFDDQPSDEPAATQSTAVESDLFSGSNSNTEALLRSAQAEYSNYEPFNEQTTVTTEASNAIESDVLGESNAPSNVTLDDNIVEYQADQNEAPRELPPTAEEIITSSSEKSGTASSTSAHEVTKENLSALQVINKRCEQELAVRVAEETRRKDDLRQQAKADLDRWYGERKRQMEQKRETMKHDEDALRTSSLEKSTKESCDWAKVIRLLDFSPGTQLSKSKRDVTRMKSCIIDAKRLAGSKNVANGV